MAALLLCGVIASALAGPAQAQMKPAMSGASSFYEPEMRSHGEGLKYPNVPGCPSVGGDREWAPAWPSPETRMR